MTIFQNSRCGVGAALMAPVHDDDSIGNISTTPISDATRKFLDAAEAAPGTDTPTTSPNDPVIGAPDLSTFYLDMTTDYVRPDFRFRFSGIEIVQSGGIVALSGKAKQGKTQFLTILAAVALSGRDFGGLQRVAPPSSVLWIDTEQSQYDLQTNMLRLYRTAAWEQRSESAAHGLYVYGLRACSPSQRIDLINQAIEKHTPGFIIIDGLRDLVNDFNDVTESNKVITWLLQVSAALPQTTIFCVLHTNDNSEKMRGHLGTELMNKCSDRFDVTRKDTHFEVRHISRHLEAPTICFYIDSMGTHQPWSAGLDDAITPDTALEQAFADLAPGGTLPFNSLVKRYAQMRVIPQAAAKAELKMLIGKRVYKSPINGEFSLMPGT